MSVLPVSSPVSHSSNQSDRHPLSCLSCLACLACQVPAGTPDWACTCCVIPAQPSPAQWVPPLPRASSQA